MRFEISERITTQRSGAEIYAALYEQFRKVSSKVEKGQGRFKASMIEASFGSINRKDETEVTIKRVEGGCLLVADVWYRPSIAFWVIFAITIFSYIGWLLPLGFYFYQKKTVSQAIKACFERIRNEFEQAPVMAQAPLEGAESFELVLERLGQMRDKGLITEEEFNVRKAVLVQKERAKRLAEPVAMEVLQPSSEGDTLHTRFAPDPAAFKGHDLPEGIKGWSWGGLLLNGFWAIGNRTWIGLLSFVPVIGLPVPFVLGAKGREWAWRNRQWDSIEHFQQVQRKWTIAGVIVYAVTLPLFALDHFYPEIEQHFHQTSDHMTMAEAMKQAMPEQHVASEPPSDNGGIQDQEPPPPGESARAEPTVWTPIFATEFKDKDVISTVGGPVRLQRLRDGSTVMVINGLQMFKGDDAQHQRPVHLFTLPNGSEALLVESSGGRGNSCETLLFFVLLDTKGRWDWTPLIGTCARDGSFRQDGPAIELQIPMMGGVTSYRLEGGTVYENGKPVEISTDNDPGL